MIETIYNVLKVTAIIAISSVFLFAINGLIGLLMTNVTPFIPEFFNMLSMYLPFNASAVMGAVLSVLFAILSFKVAKKIFDLTSWGINSA